MEKKDSYLFKYYISVLLLFVVDSLISYFLPANYNKLGITVVPLTGLMMYTLLVKTIDGVHRYFFGAIIGLYYSIVYSNSLAIYILIYVIIAFVRSYIIKIDEFSLLEAFVFIISTIFIQEVVVYFLMKITSITNIALSYCMLYRILPTLGLNAVLFFIVFFIYNRIKIEVK
jgi:rod shape-determining protein MreD